MDIILRINFCDNDFSYVVEQACNSIMDEILNVDSYIRYRNEHGIENIRKAIVLASYGFLIVRKSSKTYRKIEYTEVFAEDHLVRYLDENIEIEEVTKYEKINEDYSVCYIDLDNMSVHLQ